MQALTEVKSRFVQSGVSVRDPRLDGLLVGGGKTFDMSFWNDLADVDANVSVGASGTSVVPLNITSHREVASSEPEPGLEFGRPRVGAGR